jgi:hypothetical protein
LKLFANPLLNGLQVLDDFGFQILQLGIFSGSVVLSSRLMYTFEALSNKFYLGIGG